MGPASTGDRLYDVYVSKDKPKVPMIVQLLNTLEELGKEWGLSRERVRQVEKSTRNFLSRYLADFDEAA